MVALPFRYARFGARAAAPLLRAARQLFGAADDDYNASEERSKASPSSKSKSNGDDDDDVLRAFEEVQIVRYRTSEKFAWHEDASPRAVARKDGSGGQRLATLLVCVARRRVLCFVLPLPPAQCEPFWRCSCAWRTACCCLFVLARACPV